MSSLREPPQGSKRARTSPEKDTQRMQVEQDIKIESTFEADPSPSGSRLAPAITDGVGQIVRGLIEDDDKYRTDSDPELEPDVLEAERSAFKALPAAQRARAQRVCKGVAAIAVKNRLGPNVTRQMLCLLQPDYPGMPVDVRAVLDVPTTIFPIHQIPGGLYWHRGLEDGLRKNYTNESGTTDVEIDIHIDQVSLSSHPQTVAWTILGRVHELKQQLMDPFVIGAYTGEKRPERMDKFLVPFVMEAKKMCEENITIDGASIKLRAFYCNPTVHSLIKATVHYGSQMGCHKCTLIAHRIGKHMSYPFNSAERKTDQIFRALKYDGHHAEKEIGEGDDRRIVNVQSPLVHLQVDMVQDFLVGDEDHLLHMGILRKLLHSFVHGNGSETPAMRPKTLGRCSTFLQEVTLPCECSPQHFPQLTKSMNQWDRPHFGNLLKYVGIVIFKMVLPKALFDIYMPLHWGVCLLSSNYYKPNWEFANRLFVQFLHLYQIKFTTINYKFHCLTHLVDEVKRFGPLCKNSSRPFDNALAPLRHIVDRRKPVLEQVASTLLVREGALKKKINIPTYPTVSNPNSKQHGTYLRVIVREGFTLRADSPSDCWFLVKSKQPDESPRVVKFLYASVAPFLVTAVPLVSQSVLFNLLTDVTPPLPKELTVFKSYHNTSTLNSPTQYPLEDILCKLVVLPIKNLTTYNPMHETLPNEIPPVPVSISSPSGTS